MKTKLKKGAYVCDDLSLEDREVEGFVIEKGIMMDKKIVDDKKKETE